MVSHLVFSASEREIRDQISELENIPVANPLLVNSLGMHQSHPSRLGLNFSSDIVLAADLLRDLYTPSTDFFTTFCIEKDQMNHAYRQLVQRYAMAMTSNRHEINVYKILLFPSIYVLRFLNSYTRVWWFFQPLPWSSQIEAEASYRIKEFVQQSSVQIDAIIATHRRLDVRLDIQVVQAAIIQAASIQSRFEDEIADYSFWQRQFQAPRHLEYLTKNLALVERILNHLKKVKQFIQTVKAHSLDLIGQVQILYQNLNSDHISTLGSTSLGLILDKSFDDLASLYHTENMAYIHTIKQSCENDKIFPREQYPICLIDSLRVILSRIDNDDLGIHQRSWCIEQRNAMERYQPRNHTTLLAQILLQEVINEYYKQGLAVPTGSSPQPTIQI
ncbi:MAG: hypothetical protein LQ337_003803 [Flavoplaca oasis]|nr:MAG: hypothetical protein LQ337_003803 [Flavoplaca oasis]